MESFSYRSPCNYGFPNTTLVIVSIWNAANNSWERSKPDKQKADEVAKKDKTKASCHSTVPKPVELKKTTELFLGSEDQRATQTIKPSVLEI